MAVALGTHTDHVYIIVVAFPRSSSCTRHLVFLPKNLFVTTTLRATAAIENVTVRESARLRARRAESGAAHPQSSTQPGPGPAATATPSTAQPGAALADGLPGTTDTTPSHLSASSTARSEPKTQFLQILCTSCQATKPQHQTKPHNDRQRHQDLLNHQTQPLQLRIVA